MPITVRFSTVIGMRQYIICTLFSTVISPAQLSSVTVPSKIVDSSTTYTKVTDSRVSPTLAWASLAMG